MYYTFDFVHFSAQQAGKSIDQHSCPYFYATLLESQRRYPSGETVLHRTDEEIEYRGKCVLTTVPNVVF